MTGRNRHLLTLRFRFDTELKTDKSQSYEWT